MSSAIFLRGHLCYNVSMRSSRFQRYLSPALLILVAGGLLTLAFPPFPYYALVWFALVFFFWALEEVDTLRGGFMAGFCLGLVHVSTTMYWVYVSVHRYGGLPAWGAVALTFAGIFFLSFFWALAGLAYVFLRRMNTPYLFPFAAVLIEYVRGIPIIRFPWGGVAMALPPHLAISQVVDMVGVYGLGFVVYVVNYLIYQAILDLKEKRNMLVARDALLIALLLLACQLYGTRRIETVRRQVVGWEKVKVCVIQPDIGQADKWLPSWKVRGLNRYLIMTERAAKGFRPDLVVWSEAAVTFYLAERPGLTKKILELARRRRFNLVFGALSYQLASNKTVYHNSAYLVSPEGEIVGRYDKTRLVPFGEFVPLRRWLPFIKNIVGAEEDFTPGRRLNPLDSNLGPLGTTICFEGIFPEIARELVRKGAVLLLNLTNDGWFGRSSGPYQHLRLTAYRAVEDRVFLVRATGTGVSAVVTPVGRIPVRVPLDAEGFLKAAVRLRQGGMTVYVKYGDVFVVFCGLVLLLAGGWAVLKRIMENRRQK